MRMPRPPPPADAFTMTGNVVTSAGSVQVGSVGTFASAIRTLASSFEPIMAITLAGGPIQVRPAPMTASANSARSARNP